MNHEKLGLFLNEEGKIVSLDYAQPRPRRERSYSADELPGSSLDLVAMSSGRRPGKKKRRRSTRRSKPESPFDLKPKRRESPAKFRQRVKTALGLLDLDQDILEMNLATLRKHFGYKKGSIQRGLFVRNVIWQVYRQVQAGNPPSFVKNGGNIRSLWYLVKPLVRRHSRSFSGDDMGDLFSAQLTIMTRLGLLGYRDLNLTDTNKDGRWVAPPYGTPNVILMAEKAAFSSKFIDLGKQYGVTVQTTGGASSRVTVDTLLTEMAEAGHDLTRPFTVFALVDFEPAGWNIAEEFVKQMRDLGLKRVNAYRPYGDSKPAQPWIDIISPKELSTDFMSKYRFSLKKSTRSSKLCAQWVEATGGLYGRKGKEYGLAADELIDLVDNQLANKLPPHLSQSPERFQRLAALEDLVTVTKRYLTTRVLAD